MIEMCIRDSLYAALHPGYTLTQRVDALQRLRRAGYEIGSGFIVGVPGQRPETLADDILLARELHVDMCGAGPFIPQADTPLGNEPQGSVELALRCLLYTSWRIFARSQARQKH